MKQVELAKLSFAELRDRLKAGSDEFDKTDDIDLPEALGYLTTLPENAHTPESVDALIQLARIFFFAAQPVEALQAASVASRLASALDQGSYCATRRESKDLLCLTLAGLPKRQSHTLNL